MEGGGGGFWLWHDESKPPPPSVKALQFFMYPLSSVPMKIMWSSKSSTPNPRDKKIIIGAWGEVSKKKNKYSVPHLRPFDFSVRFFFLYFICFWVFTVFTSTQDTSQISTCINLHYTTLLHKENTTTLDYENKISVRCLINLNIDRFNIFMHCI